MPHDDAVNIAITNGILLGLSSGVCTDDFRHMQRCIAGLRGGTVDIWEVPGCRTEMSPVAGVKDGGNGTGEGVVAAMRRYTTVKPFSLPWP